jgi:hypothetical protein
MVGRPPTSSPRAQKSAANRATSGVPITTEIANSGAVATVLMIGWTK